jgi:hypothetical protein
MLTNTQIGVHKPVTNSTVKLQNIYVTDNTELSQKHILPSWLM